MNQLWINALALGAGMFLGPYSFLSAEAAQPPLDWQAIVFVFTCMPFALLFVIGIQLIRSDPKYSKSMIMIFTPLSFLLFGMGLGGVAVSIYYDQFGPSSMLYLAIGTGMLIGAVVSKIIFNAKFSDAL